MHAYAQRYRPLSVFNLGGPISFVHLHKAVAVVKSSSLFQMWLDARAPKPALKGLR